MHAARVLRTPRAPTDFRKQLLEVELVRMRIGRVYVELGHRRQSWAAKVERLDLHHSGGSGAQGREEAMRVGARRVMEIELQGCNPGRAGPWLVLM